MIFLFVCDTASVFNISSLNHDKKKKKKTETGVIIQKCGTGYGCQMNVIFIDRQENGPISQVAKNAAKLQNHHLMKFVYQIQVMFCQEL